MVKEARDQSTLQAKIPEDKVVEEAPEQASVPELVLDPVVILTPSAEVEIPKDPQQVPTPVSNSSQIDKFPFSPRFIEDNELDKVWGTISDRQAKTGPDVIFAEYNDVAIRVSIYDHFYSFSSESLSKNLKKNAICVAHGRELCCGQRTDPANKKPGAKTFRIKK